MRTAPHGWTALTPLWAALTLTPGCVLADPPLDPLDRDPFELDDTDGDLQDDTDDAPFDAAPHELPSLDLAAPVALCDPARIDDPDPIGKSDPSCPDQGE